MFSTYLAKAISYQDYIQLIAELHKQNKVTGPTQNEMLLNYSKLNEHRMSRAEKTFKPIENLEQSLSELKKEIYFLVLTEGWCGDAAQSIPVIKKLCDLSVGKIELKILLRDENTELMDKYLTNGGRSIPKIIAIDKQSGTELFNWGPRPDEAQKIVIDYKKQFPDDKLGYAEVLHKWYAVNRGKSIQKEILELVVSQ